jgi:hypothetical protein
MPLQLHPDDQLTPETYERLENTALLEERVAELEARLTTALPESQPQLVWRAIIGAGVTGGLLTGVNALILPWHDPVNAWLYWLCPIVAGAFIGCYVRHAFTNGLAAGLLIMAVQSIVLYLGWPTFAELNPDDVDPAHPGGFLPFLLWELWRLGPGYGLLCGAVAWLARRCLHLPARPLVQLPETSNHTDAEQLAGK